MVFKKLLKIMEPTLKYHVIPGVRHEILYQLSGCHQKICRLGETAMLSEKTCHLSLIVVTV